MTNKHAKVIILGSGPAGYTAAIYAARAMLKPVVIQGSQPGGQMTITTDVENYPGFAEVVQGPWLMEQMQAQAEHVGTEFVMDHIAKVDLQPAAVPARGRLRRHLHLRRADHRHRRPGALARPASEETVQGLRRVRLRHLRRLLLQGQGVAVIGGGNTAVEEALFLTNFASKVTIVHRRDSFRAEKIMQERLFKNPKIEVVWNSVLEEVVGTDESQDRHRRASCKNVKTGEIIDAEVDGVFVAIGHAPATELFKGQLEMNASGYLITAPDSTRTSIPGVFAAGDVKDEVFRQAVTAAGMGCMAALEAERYLAKLENIAKAAE